MLKLVVLIGGFSVLFAQDTAGVGGISGTVRPTGAERICVVELQRCVPLGPNGAFQIGGLRPGDYVLEVSAAPEEIKNSSYIIQSEELFNAAGGTTSILDAQLIRDLIFLTGQPAPFTNREGSRKRFRERITADNPVSAEFSKVH